METNKKILGKINTQRCSVTLIWNLKKSMFGISLLSPHASTTEMFHVTYLSSILDPRTSLSHPWARLIQALYATLQESSRFVFTQFKTSVRSIFNFMIWPYMEILGGKIIYTCGCGIATLSDLACLQICTTEVVKSVYHRSFNMK
jgi:hypothetical protein